MEKTKNSYKKSGVNISLANTFVKHIAKISKKKTKSDNIGSFASIFDLGKLRTKDPLIVSCTDGVGTKLDLANKFKKFDTIGIDLVAMCVNDLIVQGARPLFFLDYIAIGKINIKKLKLILKGIIKGCSLSKCELSGGETAEMPGIYDDTKFDLAGFAVGIVERKKLLNKKKVKVKDVILAVPSNGVHSNGYSLIRSIIKKTKISKKIKKELLKPTKIYSREVLKLCEKNLINSGAHITGGGLIENILRSVPNKYSIEIDLSKIKINNVFKWVKKNNISDKEMLSTFNCGVGFCLIANSKNVTKIQKHFSNNYKPYVIGNITKGKSNIYGKLRW